MRKRVLAVFSAFFLISLASASAKDDFKPAQSVPELKQQIEKILKDSHTPGVSVAIVHKDGPEWVGAVGLADVAANRPATSDTLFRIGSTSKAFASLSILKLVDQGKLSLDEPIRNLIPEIAFQNRWESTDPVRVVHLLEHTTGWDDLQLRDYAFDADGTPLRTALDYAPASRVSRWRPGTRMSYCNTGPAVAAYIVEKITGQRFEDYVQQNFFAPIGMKTATYLPPAANAVTLYHGDGKTPFRYWHIIYRPAGSINASAADMAAYVQLYLNRGIVNGVPVISPADLDRMEVPVSTWAAKDGLKAGYGLSNYWNLQDGFVFHGHNGGVEGGLTEMAYMADYGVGYFFSINSGNGDAFEKISKAMRGYVTSKLQRPAVPAAAPLPSDAATYAGWYEPASPRQELVHFIERIAGLRRVQFRDGKMILSEIGGNASTFIPVSGRLFRYVPKEGAPEPVATAALLTPNSEGTFILAGSTLKRIPASLAVTEICLTAFVALALVSAVVYAPFWWIGGLIPRRRRPAERAMRLYPLVAIAALVAFVAVIAVAAPDAISLLGHVTWASVAICVSTLVFAAAALMSARSVARANDPTVRTSVRTYSGITACALLILLAYLAWWGVIGLRTWA